jgi:hypothetical protein
VSALATPEFRKRHHDIFEASHRFGAWAVLLPGWINAALLAHREGGPQDAAVTLLASPHFWMLAVSTCLAVWPWLLLRRVPVSVDRPSDHAAVVRPGHRYVPAVDTTRAISRRPLLGWHPCACVPTVPGEPGYRMVVSRAGNWTADFIDNPPTHGWVKGVATAKKLFTRVLHVATGSGVGPVPGHLFTDTQGTRLVWVAKQPRDTYGDALVSTGADAVICVANAGVTDRVVRGLESRGVPAFGPIWDS